MTEINCSHDDHGDDGLTFKIPKWRAELMKAADESFTCPDGHSRTWKDPVVERARKQFKEYVLNKDRFEEENQVLERKAKKEKRKRKQMEQTFAQHIAEPGIVDAANNRYYWKCSCGAVAMTGQSTEKKAQNLLDQHIENVHDGEEPEADNQ